MAKKSKTRKTVEKSHAQVLWLAIVAATLGLTFLRSSSTIPDADRQPASINMSRIAPVSKTR